MPRGKHKHKAKDGAAPKPHARLSVAAQINFQNMLDKADLDGDGEIDLDELKIAMDNQTFSWDSVHRHLGSVSAWLGLIVFLCSVVAVSIPSELVGEYYIHPDNIRYEIGAFTSVYPTQDERGVGNNTQQKSNNQARSAVALMQTCDDLEFDMTDPCINSLLIRCGVKQGSAISGLICGVVGALTAWSRKPCFRKVSACTTATATMSWLLVFAIVITFVNKDGFQYFYNNQVLGVGVSGCGFKGYGPTPQLVEYGPSFNLYIWGFAGSLICFVLKMLDIFKGPNEHAHKVGPTADQKIEEMIKEGLDEAEESDYSSDSAEDGRAGSNMEPTSPQATKAPSFLPPATSSAPKSAPKVKLITKDVLRQNSEMTETGMGGLMAPSMASGPPGVASSRANEDGGSDGPWTADESAALAKADFSVTRQGVSEA